MRARLFQQTPERTVKDAREFPVRIFMHLPNSTRAPRNKPDRRRYTEMGRRNFIFGQCGCSRKKNAHE